MRKREKQTLAILAFIALVLYLSNGSLFQAYTTTEISLGTGSGLTADLSPYITSTTQLHGAEIYSDCNGLFFSSAACPGNCNLQSVLIINGYATWRSECWDVPKQYVAGGRDECFEPQPLNILGIIRNSESLTVTVSGKGLCNALLRIEYDPTQPNLVFDINEPYECEGYCVWQQSSGEWYSYCAGRVINDLVITDEEYQQACRQVTTTTTIQNGEDGDVIPNEIIVVGSGIVILMGLIYYKRVKKR